MTKSEIRKARKAARAAGQRLTGELLEEQGPAVEWTETSTGLRARELWARRYNDLDGPEGDWDR